MRKFIIFLIVFVSACSGNDTKPQQEKATPEKTWPLPGYNNSSFLERIYGTDNSAELNQYITVIAKKILKTTSISDQNINIKILNTSYVNALALPGNTIIITKGILASLSSEAQLAALLAHELAHIEAGHNTKSLEYRARNSELASKIRKGFKGEEARKLTSVFVKVSNQYQRRKKELEADQLALKYLAKTEYPASSMKQLIEILELQHGNITNTDTKHKHEVSQDEIIKGILSSHPSYDKRIGFISEQLAKLTIKESDISKIIGETSYLKNINGMKLPYDSNKKIYTLNIRKLEKQSDIDHLAKLLASMQPEPKELLFKINQINSISDIKTPGYFKFIQHSDKN